MEDRTTVNNVAGPRSSGGGWAVAAIVAVLVAFGVFYFSGSGTGDGVDPNANTSSIGSEPSPTTPPVTAPAENPSTGVQPVEPNAPATNGQ